MLPRSQHGREENVGLPLVATEALVDAGRDKAGRCAETDVQDHGAGHEGTSVSWRQESEAGKHCPRKT